MLNDFIKRPLTVTQMKMQMDDNFYISANINVHISDIVGVHTEDFLNMLSRRITCTELLTDIQYAVIELKDINELIINVRGNVEDIIRTTDDPQLEIHHEFREFHTTDEMNAHLKYWSNACGDLHKHGKRDIDNPSELPKELQIAYSLLWEEGNGCLEYLAEYKGRYYIALINEFDEQFASDAKMSMSELYKTLKEHALNLYHNYAFQNTILLTGNKTGIDNCHEVIFLVPAMVSKHTYDIIEYTICKNIWPNL